VVLQWWRHHRVGIPKPPKVVFRKGKVQLLHIARGTAVHV
jgi:hypothetical protein